MFVRIEDARPREKIPEGEQRLVRQVVTTDVLSEAIDKVKLTGLPYQLSTLIGMNRDEPFLLYHLDFGGPCFTHEPRGSFDLDDTSKLTFFAGWASALLEEFEKELKRDTDYAGIRLPFWLETNFWCSRIEAQRLVNHLKENEQSYIKQYEDFKKPKEERAELF